MIGWIGKPSCTQPDVDSHQRPGRLRYLAGRKVHHSSCRGIAFSGSAAYLNSSLELSFGQCYSPRASKT